MKQPTNQMSGVDARGFESWLAADVIVALLPYPDKPWPALVPRDYLDLPAPLRKPFAALWLLQDHAWERRRSRAMPRSLEAQLGYLRMLLEGQPGHGRIDLVLRGPDDEVPDALIPLFAEVVAPGGNDPRSRCDAIVARLRARPGALPLLVYADAIGYGNHLLERCLRGRVGGRILILNGRRRLFVLDTAMRRALCWRRLLARSRLVEVGLAIAAILVGCTLAGWDGLRGAMHGRRS